MTIFVYAIKRGLLTPLALILNCIIPLAVAIFFEGTENGMHFNLIAMLILWAGFSTAKSIQKDKTDGVLIRILAGPVTMRNYLIQNFLAALVPMVILSTLIGLAVHFIHGWDFTVAAGLTIIYIFIAASSIGLSFAWSCLFKNQEAGMIAMSAVLTLTGTIGGFLVPLNILPQSLYYIGAALPAHWASRSLNAIINYGFTDMFWYGILAMTLFTVAFILYGSKRRLV